MTNRLFGYIEELQAERPWGAVLDAGTGVNSSAWLSCLRTDSLTAVTGASAHAIQVRKALGARLRRQDRLLVGDWADEGLLQSEQFDTVLADYLVGAVEGFSPYFQQRLFRRLRLLVGGRLYVVGLDPYVVGDARTPAGELVQAIGRLRDACLLHAGETPYREFPAEWVVDSLRQSGFKVAAAERFAIRYKQGWIDGQLNMAAQRLARIEDRGLASALNRRIADLRETATALCSREDGLRHGYDYVIAATPAD